MPEILDHGERRCTHEHFLTAFHATEMRERLQRKRRRIVRRDRQRARRRGHRRIARVIKSRQRPAHLRPRLAAPEQAERRPVGVLREIDDARVGLLAQPHADDARPRQRPEGAQVVVVGIHDHPAVARHDAREVAEGALHVGQIAEDVGVVELQIVEHRDVRRVVDEFAALVEKRAVVLVALDHERIVEHAEVVAHRRIDGHAADQKTGIAPRGAQQVRGERGRGRLSVRAADDDIAPQLEHRLVQEGRQRGKRQAARVEQPLDLGIAAAHGVADHDQIGCEFFEPRRIVALVQRDAGLGEHRAHRRIDSCIRAEHLVPGLARQQRRVAHRRPANAHEVDLHFCPIFSEVASPMQIALANRPIGPTSVHFPGPMA